MSISRVGVAVRSGNNDVGGRLGEFGGLEYMIRGRGYARSLHDFGDIVLTASEEGTPIGVKDVGQVALGPDLRRGISDLDGQGEVVSEIGRAHVELQSPMYLVCRLLLEKKKRREPRIG